jgi:hypothetical protein
MTTRPWIRRLFAHKPRTIRKDRVRFRPCLEWLEKRVAPTVNISNNFSGLSSGAPPDTCGAAGRGVYVETVNSSVAIDNTISGTNLSSGLGTFFQLVSPFDPRVQGPLYLTDASCCFDEPINRFIVATIQLNVDSSGHYTAPNYLDLCVSKSSNPRTLTALDWKFYQFQLSGSGTTEGNSLADYTGNIGYNQDALVFTFNMTSNSRSQVVALSQTDLKNLSSSIQDNTFDLGGWSYRPVTMHDSVAGGPMWLVQGGGGSNPLNPIQGGGSSINLVRIDNILNATDASATCSLKVNPFGGAIAPLNPNGNSITSDIDTRILKAAERNNDIVACQNVGVVNAGNANEDDARWYELNVSDPNHPYLVQQGNVGFGANTYTVYPGIDINPAGDIGMSVIRSGTDNSTDFMSVYVAGRTAADAPGLMYTQLAKAGDSNNTDKREGDYSGISIDPFNGTFWTANEFTSGGSGATQITNFSITDTVQASVDSNGVLQVVGSNANDNIVLQPNPSNSSQTQVLNNGTVVGNFANSSFSSINVVEGPGNDTLTLTDTGGRSGLQFFPVPVTYTGGGGSNSLILDDSTGTNTYVYTVTGNTVSRNGFGGLTYSNVSNLALYDGSFHNTVQVLSTSANVEIRTDGQDAVYIGSNGSALGGNVQGINGSVYVHGSGAASLVVDDSGDTTGRTVQLFPSFPPAKTSSSGWLRPPSPGPRRAAPAAA